MRILVITDQAIGPSHGTGALLVRYFKDVPSVTIFNACAQMSAEADLKTTVVVPDRSEKYRAALRNLPRLKFSAAMRAVSKTFYESLLAEIRAFDPDLIWIIVCTRRGIRVARQVIELFPRVPCYSSFWDLVHLEQLDQPAAKADLMHLSDRSQLMDAISDPLAEELTRRIGRSVGVEDFFCADRIQTPTQARRWDPGQANLVMVGNVWLRDAFATLQKVVQLARRTRPEMGDVVGTATSLRCIDWGSRRAKCQRDSLMADRVLDFPPSSGLEIFVWYPFMDRRHTVRDTRVSRCLRRLPSCFRRGVPVFSISGPTTAFARYLEETGTGVTVSPDSISGAAGVLSQLLDDSDKRDRMGQRARDYAQEHFEIDAFRERLLTRLRGIMVDRLSPIDRNLKPP
jgi:hypothetical protein